MRWRHWRSAFRSSLSASPTTRRTCIAGRYHAPDADLGLECLVTLCLAGPEAEKQFCGPITDNSDRVDYEMAYAYLARQLNPLQVGAEFVRYRDAAQRLIRSPWAQHRVRLLADALLRHGTLSGDEIGGLTSLSRRIRVVHAP
jgi:hypothetical protein